MVFSREVVSASFNNSSGEPLERSIEIRINPISFRTSRITGSRSMEKEAGTNSLPKPPPDADDTSNCPFCQPQLFSMTPRLNTESFNASRLRLGSATLFPNLYPYGSYSAVSLIDDVHFVEIGTASERSYQNSFKLARQYLQEIRMTDPDAKYMAITQNHLPSAGGSLLHPHLQINADRVASNHHRFLEKRSHQYYQHNGTRLFSDYLAYEQQSADRYIGATLDWHWVAAYAPEGFFEIWGLLPGAMSLQNLSDRHLTGLCAGIMHAQKFYRSLNRNGYNLGLLAVESESSQLELRIVLVVRSNYAPWVRNDFTGFEVMLGDMATFVAPELTAQMARTFW
ncbi:MAG: galactose-1-phosphate uridylyltransferase [Deltaproteobacteria bacterium]|nr:galactose-1-phosphate uridylyltransferase [Deltaproteobacteria bacterium]